VIRAARYLGLGSLLALAATLAPGVAAAQDEPEAQPEVDPPRAVRLQLGAGAGIGALGFTRPVAVGRQTLPDTQFAASELFMRAHVNPEEPLSLEGSLVYQSSVGLELELEPLFGLPEQLDVRIQRVELSAAPVVRLGDDPRSPALAFPLGVSFSAFSSGVPQYPIDDYRLAGPHVRVEVWLPLLSWAALRLGPEAQWLLLLDASLRDRGACCQGVAVGGQGSLEAAIGSTLRLALSYRQSHAFVGGGDDRFRDLERFATLRIAGEL
jgi:hypothetical protein